jgi:hypothetical protein
MLTCCCYRKRSNLHSCKLCLSRKKGKFHIMYYRRCRSVRSGLAPLLRITAAIPYVARSGAEEPSSVDSRYNRLSARPNHATMRLRSCAECSLLQNTRCCNVAAEGHQTSLRHWQVPYALQQRTVMERELCFPPTSRPSPEKSHSYGICECDSSAETPCTPVGAIINTVIV